MLARQTGSAQAGSYCWPLIRPLGYDAADEPPRPHAGAGLLMLSVMATPAQADAGCQFQLGLRALHDLDAVAYVRFASVYRSFRDVHEFMRELEDLIAKRRAGSGGRQGRRGGKRRSA